MNETSDEKRILLVGLCCLDVCNYVEKYPAEDTDNRVFEQVEKFKTPMNKTGLEILFGWKCI